MKTNAFPRFSDGDVEIFFTADDPCDKYVLHSWALALHSSWFKASLSERWRTSGIASHELGGESNSPKPATTSVFGDRRQAEAPVAASETKNKWQYELRFEEGTSEGLLMRKGAETQCELHAESPECLCSEDDEEDPGDDFHMDACPFAQIYFETSGGREECIKAHKHMLGAIYHSLPEYDDADFEEISEAVTALGKVSDAYGCEPIVRLHIKNNLHNHRTQILKTCSLDPIEMLELAIAVKADWIFQEAATNLLGRSKRFWDTSKVVFTALGISKLMKRKRGEFIKKLRDCEHKLLCLAPAANTWRDQNAVNMVRQWVAQQLSVNKGSELGPGYAHLYHAAHHNATVGNFYTHNAAFVAQWMKGLPNEAGNLTTAAKAYVEATFARASSILAPVLVDKTRRQPREIDMHRSLLFMEIDDEELPWVTKSD